VLAQMRNPAITNEDMQSVPKLVHVVEKLVAAKAEEGGAEELGGEAAITEFYASVEVRLSRIQREVVLMVFRYSRNCIAAAKDQDAGRNGARSDVDFAPQLRSDMALGDGSAG